jgi:acyl-CoA hydrolase
MSSEGKPPSASAVEDNVYKVFPNDLNAEYTVFGGLVMGLCDRTALIVAERHSGRTCVTAAVDSLNFLAPAQAGETLILKAAINRSWDSSMEIGVRVVAENSHTGESRHVVSAYFTFVGLDENNRPASVPPVAPQTEAEKRRYQAAEVRRAARLDTLEDVGAL